MTRGEDTSEDVRRPSTTGPGGWCYEEETWATGSVVGGEENVF